MVSATIRLNYELGDVFTLKPLFDLHIGNAGHNRKLLTKYLAGDTPQTYYVGGGDILDCIIPGDAKRYRKQGDATRGDAVLDEQVDEACRILSPIRERILGFLSGNHEDTILKHCATDVTRQLRDKLSTPEHTPLLLGKSCFLNLAMRQKDGGGRTLRIYMHHGWGRAAMTEGAGLTKYARAVAYYDADLYLFGHTHERVYKFIPRIVSVGSRIEQRPRLVAVCGSYENLHSDGPVPSYAESVGCIPTALGGLTITIRPTSSWVEIGVSE